MKLPYPTRSPASLIGKGEIDHPWRTTAIVVIPYLLFAGLWILLSDWLLLNLSTPEAFLRLSVYKGLAFVIVTGLLLTAIVATRERARLKSQQAIINLVNVIQVLSAAQSREDIRSAACFAARELTRADGAIVILKDDTICHYQDMRSPDPKGTGIQIPAKSGFSDWVMTLKEPVFVQHVDQDSGVPVHAFPQSAIQSLAVVPVDRENPTVAICACWNQPRKVGKDELRLLEIVADASAIALARTESHQELEAKVQRRTAQLKLATEQAQSADRLKSAFLATMSHELRTPLNSIIGFTGIILKGLAGPLTNEQAKQLNMVKSSSHHLLSLINDILDLSKIEAGQLAVQAEPFPLGEAVQKAMGLVEPLAEAKGLELRAEVSPFDLEVELNSDRRRVEQVLINLLANAVNFTESGHITLSLAREDSRVSLAVQDTGCGIDEANLPRIFDPFNQVDNGASRRVGGTGLGLAISQRLARLLGGDVLVQSSRGIGTTFTFNLPLTPTI